MTRAARFFCSFLALWGAMVLETPAHAESRQSPPIPDGVALVRLMGGRAAAAFAPHGAPGIGALVRLPSGTRAGDMGLHELVPGFGRLWGDANSIVAFGDSRPGVRVEVSPPLHLLLDRAAGFVNATVSSAEGLDGSGALVGVADTGLDVTHPDFLDAAGHTRVAWLLDLSTAPLGKHPDLERTFGTPDAMGNIVTGAVWSGEDIDAAIGATPQATLPQDEVGHGTLVASIAAGGGLNGHSPYRGIAPAATLVIARITGAGTDAIGNDDLLRGVGFLFNRATALQKPIVVNLSIGSDFGPHDGTLAWEQVLATYVGPTRPGRALVAAAGNSGSISETPIHQNVYVSAGTTTRVPIVTSGAQSGGLEVWVAMHSRADLSVGLDAPDNTTWIAPVDPGASAGKNTKDYNAAVVNGSGPSMSPVPPGSHGAVVVIHGKWQSGTYVVTLRGSGTADLYVQGTGDAAIAGVSSIGFLHGVREGTINLPATHPSIIGVGCTINRGSWQSIDNSSFGLHVPVLDETGGSPVQSLLDGSLVQSLRDPFDGEPCWFSSEGPTLTGIQKPEIMAPGAAIVGAMSQQALPSTGLSLFAPPCDATASARSEARCNQIDALHGVASGTSFSAPIVAGAIAVLFQRDPTLTQDQIVAALQGGAHPLRGPAPYDQQPGAGEVDVVGALAAADRLRAPRVSLPVRAESWITLGAEHYEADGALPLEAVIELRGARESPLAPAPSDGFAETRLAAYARVDGQIYPNAIQTLVRRGPGVWLARVDLPAGLGGRRLTVGATFDSVDIVDPKSVPIATDIWNGNYAAALAGACAIQGRRAGARGSFFASVVLVLAALGATRRARRRYGG